MTIAANRAHHVYALALGSNRAGTGHQRPQSAIARALTALDTTPLELFVASQIVTSAPLGPSRRCFANAAALVVTKLSPPALLCHLKGLERAAGRRPGRRWGARSLDLDIIWWSGGLWATDELTIPHPAFRQRHFVLDPLASIAPMLRDPLTGRTLRQLAARLRKRKPVDRPPGGR